MSTDALRTQRADRRADLVARLPEIVEFAGEATSAILGGSWPLEIRPPEDKFVAETALLLYNVAPVAALDQHIPAHVGSIASAIKPPARSDEVRAAICLDPGRALDHGCAHVLLAAIGYDDDSFSELLRSSLQVKMAPERFPHRRLEQSWLRTLSKCSSASPDGVLISESMLARPLDALSSSRFDFYGFTHAVMYASDFGAHPPALISAELVQANAIAGLAFAVQTLDYDLAAELLMTWPMLALAWPEPAATVFDWLTRVQDRMGFLSGRSFDAAAHAALSGHERQCYILATCYHTMYVMGFLCACALRFDRCPPVPNIAGSDLELSPGPKSNPAPYHVAAVSLASLDQPQQLDALGPLLLTIALRGAAAAGDIPAVRAMLQLALEKELTEALAVGQATDFLHRAVLLDKTRACQP